MNLMTKLIFRELLNARRFSLLFIINLALGLLGFVIIHSFKESVNSNLESRSKILLGSDLTLAGRRDLNEVENEKVKEVLKDKVVLTSDLVEIYSMGKALNKDSKSRLVLIKMIDENYPLYGHLRLKEEGSISPILKASLRKSPTTWISEELAHQMKLKIGDQLKLGEEVFLVSDIIKDDSSSSFRGFGLAPKLYISKKFQDNTKLISFGSVASFAHLYKLKEEFQTKDMLAKLKQDIAKELTDPAISIVLPDNSSEQVGRILNYLSDYLGLVALVAIFLSGIGSSYLFQNFIYSKTSEIGILKSLGLNLFNIKMIFIFELIVLSSLGVLLANTAGYVFLPLSNSLLEEVFTIPFKLSMSHESILITFIVGIFSILTTCYPLLRKMVSIQTIDMFQSQSSMNWKWSRLDFLYYLPLIGMIEILAVWQAHSLRIGTLFTLIMLFVVFFIIIFLPLFFKWLNKIIMAREGTIAFKGTLALGLSLREILRSRLSSVLTFLSLSIGVMLLSLIGQLEVSLNKELLSESEIKPSLFLFDIQMEQKDHLVSFAKEENIPLLDPTPMVRSRLLSVNEKKLERNSEEEKYQTREEEQQNRFKNRGVNLTYALKTNPSQKLIAGSEFKGVYVGEGPVEISLEERYAKRIEAKLGDRLTFDILGVEIQGVVTSLRKVKWTSFLPNFFITLQPGVLEDAPQTYLAAISQVSFEQQLEIQEKLVDKFSNISIINVTELMGKIYSLFKTMGVAIKLMAILCLLVGFFVIYAITQNQLRKKEYDVALMKAFGASSSFLIKQFLWEYLLMSIFATILGSIFSIVFGNLISYLFFDGVWSFDGFYFLTILVAISLLTIFIVLLSTFGIYKKPAKLLLE